MTYCSGYTSRPECRLVSEARRSDHATATAMATGQAARAVLAGCSNV